MAIVCVLARPIMGLNAFGFEKSLFTVRFGFKRVYSRLLSSTPGMGKEVDKMRKKDKSFEALEAASAPSGWCAQCAQWLREIPAAEYHAVFSIIPNTHNTEKISGFLRHWAWRQGKLLKSQLGYRGFVTDHGVSRRVHVHALVYGRNRQGLSLRENHRSPQWFYEYNDRKLWLGKGSIKVVEIDDLEGLIRYITTDNYSNNLFVPVFGQTSQKLL